MHPFVHQKQAAYETAIDHLQGELSSLRTGRASPSLVENIVVMAYDAPMEMKGVASIMAQDAKTILITPWDKSLLQAIEKAIRDADIGVNPAVDGVSVRISLPQMTEETRKKLVKTMRERCEEARIVLRGIREGIREDVLRREREEGMPEDEKFKILEETDKMTKDFSLKIESISEAKEEEIMTV